VPDMPSCAERVILRAESIVKSAIFIMAENPP